jgi:hypothetical protein
MPHHQSFNPSHAHHEQRHMVQKMEKEHHVTVRKDGRIEPDSSNHEENKNKEKTTEKEQQMEKLLEHGVVKQEHHIKKSSIETNRLGNNLHMG